MQCHFVFLGIFEIQCFTCAFEDMQGDHCKLYCPDHYFSHLYNYFTLLLLHPSPRGTFVFRNNLDVKTHLFKAFLVIYLVRARFSFDLKCSSREYKAYHPLFMGCSVLTDVRFSNGQPTLWLPGLCLEVLPVNYDRMRLFKDQCIFSTLTCQT